MARSAKDGVNKWFKRLDRAISDASTGPPILRQIGEWAIEIIVRRTRLGYSVSELGGTRRPFARFKPSYERFRKNNKAMLDSMTRPLKRNLTLTGQMLRSMKILKVVAKAVLIGPNGPRSDGKDNADIARWVQAGAYKGGVPRPFNFLSKPEIQQLRRLWRKTFGDLRGRFR